MKFQPGLYFEGFFFEQCNTEKEIFSRLVEFISEELVGLMIRISMSVRVLVELFFPRRD